MIAPLRRRHRVLSAVLLAVVPALYVLALLARPEEPREDALRLALAETPLAEVSFDQVAAYGGFEVRTRAGRVELRGSPAERAWAVELEPAGPIPRPEVLVYWTSSEVRGDELPGDAVLLGHLAGERPRILALPRSSLGRSGRLVLYSLGHREVLGSSDLPPVGEAPPPVDDGEAVAAVGDGR